jgi:hypothetical protein
LLASVHPVIGLRPRCEKAFISFNKQHFIFAALPADKTNSFDQPLKDPVKTGL